MVLIFQTNNKENKGVTFFFSPFQIENKICLHFFTLEFLEVLQLRDSQSSRTKNYNNFFCLETKEAASRFLAKLT